MWPAAPAVNAMDRGSVVAEAEQCKRRTEDKNAGLSFTKPSEKCCEKELIPHIFFATCYELTKFQGHKGVLTIKHKHQMKYMNVRTGRCSALMPREFSTPL
jgi:hypothetical protein